MSLKIARLVAAFMMMTCAARSMADDLYLDSPLNQSTLRFEINNDVIWKKDSNFSNGWSLQYHTKRYAGWDDMRAPELLKWVGNHFPTLGDGDSLVRHGHVIGQNMFTPGDLSAEVPQEGDLPYAGTLTYSISWQRFNRRNATTLQLTIGVLGGESLAESFQKTVHTILNADNQPEGWDTQRSSEPILNIGYKYLLSLMRLGTITNGWAGQLTLAPSASLGNLATMLDVDLAYRFGWNMHEGFATFPAPPGRGFFQTADLPKPSFASPHGIEMVVDVRGSGLLYSVVYDGSLITGDDRNVERHSFFLTGLLGLTYHYYRSFSLHLYFQASTDLLKSECLPDPPPEKEATQTDVSYGALMVDFHF